MNSDFLRLNAKDFLKGLLVAVIMAFVSSLHEVLIAGTFDFTWLVMKPIVMVSLGAGLSYLIKNFFTNSAGSLGTQK
jgi:hypothetical protein